MKAPSRNIVAAAILLCSIVLICCFVGRQFWSMHHKEEIYPSTGLTSQKMLSSYFQGLRNTPGDTEIYLYNGEEKGGHILILGGSHPNEPAGFITAVLLAENIRVRKGTVILVPRANSSGFTHSDPQEGNPQRFGLETPEGVRFFRLGSRLTNPIDQWPDPAVYFNPAGQRLSGAEVRNLNRCYPGRIKGSLTEKIAFGIMELIKSERIDLGIDVHESAPEYPVINALVFHENTSELAALACMEIQNDGFDIRLEASPANLRGLSHREWGDHTGIKAILIETANASHGRLKGKPSPSLVVEGKDKYYVRAAKLGRLFAPFDKGGIPRS